MAIDPSIALGIRPLQLADPLAQYSQFAQIQNAQNQNALAQYQLGAAQRAEEIDRITNEAYKNSLTSEGGINYNMLAANLSRGGAGKLVPAVLAAKTEQEVKAANLAKTQAETEKLARESRDAKFKALGTGLLRGMSNPDDATLESIFGDLDSNGIDTKNIRQQFAQIPDLKTRQDVIRNYALSNKEGIEALKFVSPKTEKFDLDGKVVVLDLNPNSPTYKQEIKGFEKTVSPSALLTSQTAIRGQDIGAATTERGQDIVAATAAAGQASTAATAAARLAAPSELSKLQAERDALPIGDPRREEFNKKIAKETEKSEPARYQEWKLLKDQGYKGSFQDWIKEQATLTRPPGTNISIVNTPTAKSLSEPVGKMAETSLAKAQGAAESMESANQIRAALNAGNVIAGPLAGARTKFAQVLEMAGIGDKEKLANTRNAIQGLASMTLASRADLKGQGQITDMETKLLERAKSADIGDLTIGELHQIVNTAQKVSNRLWSNHQTLLKTMEGDPEAASARKYYAPTGSIPEALGDQTSSKPSGKDNRQSLNDIFGRKKP